MIPEAYRKRIRRGGLTLVILLAPNFGVALGKHDTRLKGDLTVKARAKSQSYELNGKSVSKKTFQAFLKTLNGQEDWSCAKTSAGGITEYKAKDSGGQRYQVTFADEDSYHGSIEKLAPQR